MKEIEALALSVGFILLIDLVLPYSRLLFFSFVTGRTLLYREVLSKIAIEHFWHRCMKVLAYPLISALIIIGLLLDNRYGVAAEFISIPVAFINFINSSRFIERSST